MTNKILLLTSELSENLLSRGWSCVTAESCTGGGLAYWLTSLSGSSQWFERGFVTYSNQAKQALLDVKSNTLQTFGAVSEETAKEMAIGALNNSASHISVAITGIAGPMGGSIDKPIGTVWISTVSPTKHLTKHYLFSGDRHDVRERSIIAALELLLEVIHQ